MTNPPLSPAAQKMLNAAKEASKRNPDDILNGGRNIAIAVLTEIANQVTSDEIMDSLSGDDGEGWSLMKEREIIRDELSARAAELETIKAVNEDMKDAFATLLETIKAVNEDMKDAFATLARWCQGTFSSPIPLPAPAEGEVTELVADMRERESHCEFISGDDLRRAADLYKPSPEQIEAFKNSLQPGRIERLSAAAPALPTPKGGEVVS